MHLVIQSKPQAQARHRHRFQGGRVITFDPDSRDKKACQSIIVSQMRLKRTEMLPETPIAMELINYTKIPESWSKRRQNESIGKPCIVRPDLDNYIKFYGDVLNGIAFHDDRQITSIWSEKLYSANPRVEIILKPYGVNMISEHAITIKGEISLEDLNYMVKKANRLGTQNRQIVRVYSQEDDEGRHIYFEAEAMKSYVDAE